MSGSTVGGVIGGIVGSFVPVIGTQLGFVVGSILGGYISPDKVYGPRLTDAQTQTSTVGIPVPFGFGSFAIKGNIIWADELKERRKKRGGKGGGPTQITYTYTRSYAIGICEGPIKAIKTIKRNGKVVYEVSANAAGEYSGDTSQLTAQSAKFLKKCTIYKGDEAQLPDPTIEAVEGVGNVSPFRGLAYIVVKDDDLTDLSGAVPQYEFTVVMEGDLGNDIETELFAGRLARFGNAAWPLLDSMDSYTFTGYTSAQSSGYTGSSLQDVLDHFRGLGWSPDVYLGYSFGAPSTGVPGIGLDLSAWGVSNYVTQSDVTNSEALTLVYSQFHPDLYIDSDFDWCAATLGQEFIQGRRGSVGQRFPASPGGYWQLGEFCDTSSQVYYLAPLTIRVTRKRLEPVMPPEGASLIPDLPGYYLSNSGDIEPIPVFTEQSGSFRVLSTPSATGGDTSEYNWLENGPAVEFGDPNYDNASFWEGAYGVAVSAGKLPAGWTYGVEYPVSVASVYRGESSIVETVDRSRVILGSVVAALCERTGVTVGQVDVSQLTDLLDGYAVATIGGADSFITPLSQAYFFDPGEWDAKLRFIKRGGEFVFAIGPDDLAEREGDSIEQERVQEVELLRKVTVAYVDPAAGFAASTQTAERTVATVNAVGESAIEMPVVMSSSDAAKVAEKRLKVAWGEPDKFKIRLPYKLCNLTATDVGTLTDKLGSVHRVRLMESQEDSGNLLIELSRDCQSAYISDAAGVTPKPPVVTSPGLIGGTRIEVIDSPVLRDQDDWLGLYVAAAGQLPGWAGCTLLLSTDGGVTSTEVAEIIDPAVIGYTLTGIDSTATDYPAEQVLDVFMPEAPESVDYATLLQFANRAVLGDEIVQFHTVSELGGNAYRLSGLMRGKYDTPSIAHAAGTRFVLFDSSVMFVQAQAWTLGQTLWFKAVSFGTSADAYPWQQFSFAAGRSQTEWKPISIEAKDVGSDIQVSWIGRRRLGSTRRSVPSQHFRGYRVTYTNGGTVVAVHDVTTLTDTLSGGALLPGPVTITVAGINAITGIGTPSEAIIA